MLKQTDFFQPVSYRALTNEIGLCSKTKFLHNCILHCCHIGKTKISPSVLNNQSNRTSIAKRDDRKTIVFLRVAVTG